MKLLLPLFSTRMSIVWKLTNCKVKIENMNFKMSYFLFLLVLFFKIILLNC